MNQSANTRTLPLMLRLSKRQRAALALLLMTTVLAIKAGMEGLSHFYVESARMEINRWSTPGARIEGDEGKRVMTYLQQSRIYSKSNAWTLEEAGSVQLRIMSEAVDPQQAVAAAREALRNFRLARQERPSSPFVWSSFAMTKLYLDEKDAELVQALEQAARLGPWEPGVQESVVFTGLSVWNQLSAEQRIVVADTVQRGLRRDSKKITEIVRSFNRMDIICAIKIVPEAVAADCAKISGAASDTTGKQK